MMPSTDKPISKVRRTKTKKTTKKNTQQARNQAEKRVELEKRIFYLQQLLIDTNVSEIVLKEAAMMFQPQQYMDVVTERAIDMCCGYPCCEKKRTQLKGQHVPKYKLSLSTRRVYDNSELSLYCSPECLIASKLYLSQLLEMPAYTRSADDLKSIESIKFARDITASPSAEEDTPTPNSRLHASVVDDLHSLIMPYGGGGSESDLSKVQAQLEVQERDDILYSCLTACTTPQSSPLLSSLLLFVQPPMLAPVPTPIPRVASTPTLDSTKFTTDSTSPSAPSTTNMLHTPPTLPTTATLSTTATPTTPTTVTLPTTATSSSTTTPPANTTSPLAAIPPSTTTSSSTVTPSTTDDTPTSANNNEALLEQQLHNLKLNSPTRKSSSIRKPINTNQRETKKTVQFHLHSNNNKLQPKPNSNNNHHNIEASTTVISDDDDDDDDDDSGEHVRGDDSDGGSEGDDMSLFGVQDNSSDEESPMNVAMSSFGLMWTTLESWKTPATIKFLYMKNGLALAPPPPEDESATEDQQRFLPNNSQNSLRRQALCTSLSPHFSRLRSMLQLDSVLDQDISSFISTLTIPQALPSFSAQQWKTVALLFIELLSLQCAGLAKQLRAFAANKQNFLARCSIRYDEYNVLLNIFDNNKSK